MINQQDPMLTAVMGYRLTHGAWPSRLRACGALPRSDVHDAIAERVTIVPSQSASWIAEGDGGRQYKFDENELVSSSDRARGLLERWLATWKDGAPAAVPSAWLERELAAPLASTGLSRPALNRLGRRRVDTIGALSKYSRAELTRLVGLGSSSLIQVAALLYDRGLAFSMEFEATPAGVIVTQPGMEPDVEFARRDFDAVSRGRVVPMEHGERLTAREALGVELGAVADAALAVRPPLPGAAELERVLHDSVAHQARRSQMTASEFIDFVVRRVAAYSGMARGVASSWMAEVDDAIAGLPPNEREAGAHAYGIGRTRCDTYTEIAHRVGGTESSAYQLVQAFDARVRAMRPALPVCRRTVAALHALHKPVPITDWWEALPHEIRPSSPNDLSSLAALDAWGWIRPIAVYYGAGTYIVGTDHAEAAGVAKAADYTIDTLYQWGVARVSKVARVIGLSEQQARAALERDGRWASAPGGWFVSTGARGGHVGARVRELLRRGTPDLPALRAALLGLRTSRMRGYGAEYPPLDVLHAVVVRTTGFDDVTAKAS